jgi:diguanylate cyclase (GGDEF)-like protein
MFRPDARRILERDMAKVLLADDEAALRLLMGRQLSKAGHEVILASDGLDAFQKMEKDPTFDVVVSDVKMPKLDGMGLLFRAKSVIPDTEFIILTGHGSMENAVEAFKTGNVFDYLLKPLDDMNELDAVVDRAVERRRLKMENKKLIRDLQMRIQELEATRQELANLAEHDGLTGLLNHRTIHGKLMDYVSSHPNDHITVMMIDMDGFKQFNDTYGHQVGDQVIRHVANILGQSFSEDVFIGRCGGDEFMAVLPRCNASEASIIADRIKTVLEHRPFRNPEGVAIPIRLCFGISDTTTAGSSPINLVATADAALFEGKKKGGDAITLHMTIKEQGDIENRTTFDVLDSLVTAIDNKDRYTKRHSEDVTTYALLLAQSLSLSEETCSAVRVAGLLHDVGKIGVPDAILRKPGKLSPQEYEIMKNHVTISTLIIHGLPRLADVLDAVAYHHERWDGKGYPKGLAGEQIPLLGRVMAIADAFSAMTLDRPYRAGMSVEEALTEIEEGCGTQFDPRLARIFVGTIRQSSIIRKREIAKAA